MTNTAINSARSLAQATALTTPALDNLLLDIATTIELSNRDRQVAEKRYRHLKTHLERPSSPLAPFLADGGSLIYPQGSMATGTTVLSGDDDDRFDLDALVEVNVPPGWTPKQVLDLLEKALEGFPDVWKIVRCTRCVQLQFAFMHMDVTVMDPAPAPRTERVGEIFHSPDTGDAMRVPANPYGFSQWFRANVRVSQRSFAEELNRRRLVNGIDRFEQAALDAQQDDLPPILPPRMDAEQVVALKLLKRYLSMRYSKRDIKRPPSIYLAKLAVDVGPNPDGLYGQLYSLAAHVKAQMDGFLHTGEAPDERNPMYKLDRLNDRWPKNQNDMKVLSDDMGYLLAALEQARVEEFKEITTLFATLFGEKLTRRAADAMLLREQSRTDAGQPRQYEKETGAIVPAGAVMASKTAATVRSVPPHNFHCEIVEEE